MREHGEKRFDHARGEAVANHNAINVPGIEMSGRGLNAQRSGDPDAFTHSNAESWVEPTASGDQDSCIVESIADRQHRQLAVVRSEQFDPAQHRVMQRADAHRRLQACKQPLDRQSSIRRQRNRYSRVLIAKDARNHRNDRAVESGDLETEHACRLVIRRRTRFGDDNGRWFDGQECRWCIRPFGLDDGKGAGCCQGFNEPRGRALGDHDQWAL